MDEFYKAKTELLCDKMVIKCEERSITETHIVIDDLCAKRLVQCLGAFSKTPPTTPAPMAVYEVFTQPETLKYLDVMDLVPMLVRGHERSMDDLLVKESCVFPSAVILMTRPEDNVRAFAMSKMTTAKHKITLEEFSPMSPLVSTIVDTICLFLFFTNLIFLSLCSFHVFPVTSRGVCEPFGFPSDMDRVWQTLYGVVMRVDDNVLRKIFSDYPKLIVRVIEHMTDEGSCQKRQALTIFQEAGTRIGTTLLKGKDIQRIEYLLALLSKLFFSATSVESIRVLVLQTVLVLAETYPFPSSLFQVVF